MKAETKISPNTQGRSKTFWIFVVFSSCILIVLSNWITITSSNSLEEQSCVLRQSWKDLNQLEKLRWNSSIEYSFPEAKQLPVVLYDPSDSDLIDRLMESEKPVIIKNSPATDWDAIHKWNSEYLSKLMPTIKVHAPSLPVVRLHHTDATHPFAKLEGISWTRPWKEVEVHTSSLFKQDKLMYYMQNAMRLPTEMLSDLFISFLTVPWSPPMEVNLWMGTPTVTTPAHYDYVHNFYTQVAGSKRFIMFPPEDNDALYTFPSLHPSARQSQIDFNNPDSTSLFPEFSQVHPMEVVLRPGDVLYIPPLWFHYVSVVGENVSISISTHTESQQAKIYELLHSKVDPLIGILLKNKAAHSILEYKVNLAWEYVSLLFPKKEQAREFVAKIYSNHWSHFRIDKEALGLEALISTARQKFPDAETIKTKQISKDHKRKVVAAAKEIKGIIDQFQGGPKNIVLSYHIESFAARIVGALNVDPFFLWIIQNKQ